MVLPGQEAGPTTETVGDGSCGERAGTDSPCMVHAMVAIRVKSAHTNASHTHSHTHLADGDRQVRNGALETVRGGHLHTTAVSICGRQLGLALHRCAIWFAGIGHMAVSYQVHGSADGPAD